ncbi:MAG: hypothetical protein ACRDF4_07690 [Rhabdochlamydiaceae bacterium]
MAEGELSEEEAALARKAFIALAFVAVAFLIVGLEIFIPIQYVILGVTFSGVVWVLLYGSSPRSKRGQ